MNPGETLDGRYTITERLGAGGMGEVYKATHNFLSSTRVIKIVRPQIAGNQDAQDRFLREARAATKIHHPNVATLHDFASLPDGSHYMVWEFIDGENLAQRLRARGTLPPRAALKITIAALRGLDAVHRAGIVHRDISPENIMITHDDESVKIIDLGVAKVEDLEVSTTRTGMFVGKLRYAAPEQLGFLPEDEKIDGRTDLYALAMVLVELLTGRPPYEAKSPHEYFILHAKNESETLSIELPFGLPGGVELQKVLVKALSRNRNERYATAREFAAALEEIERSLPEQRDLPTMATPLDGDETFRVAPSQVDLHRSTVRTNAPMPAPADVTIQTPLPGPLTPGHPAPPPPPPPPAPNAANPASSAPTVATPMPFAAPIPAATPASVPAPVKRSGTPAIVIVLLVFLVGAAVIAGGLYFAWPKISQMLAGSATSDTTGTTATTVPAATTASAPAQTASTTLEVTDDSVIVDDTSQQPVGTATTATAAPIAIDTAAPPTVVARREEPPSTRNDDAVATPSDDEEVTVEEDTSHIDRTWRPGQGRRDVSWRLELQGTRMVALRAGGATPELTRALRSAFPGIRFAPRADVVVKYDRRSNRGSVSKGGRVLYVTEAASAEEFAQELADIFNGE